MHHPALLLRRVILIALIASVVAIPGPASAKVDALAGPVLSNPSEPSELALQIRARALTMIGAPYSYGGTTPAGFDCSGFTSWVVAQFGMQLSHSSVEQYYMGGGKYARIRHIKDLQIGDLVFHATGTPVGHVGIYIGNDRFISSTSSAGVRVRSLHDSYWGPLWVGGIRILK